MKFMTGNSSKYSIFLCSNKYTNKPFKFLATKLSLFILRPISQYFVKFETFYDLSSE